MKKDNVFWLLIIILFALITIYLEPNWNKLAESLSHIISNVKITSVNIDNNEIYSYSNNTNNETTNKGIPDYYNNYEFDKDLYIYYTLLNEKEKLRYKQIYENAMR